MLISALLLWRHKLMQARWMLWILMISFPLPYIANTAGWMTAEVGRQPWLVYGLMRTMNGFSPTVSAGNGWFTLLGFMGMYTVLGLLFVSSYCARSSAALSPPEQVRNSRSNGR